MHPIFLGNPRLWEGRKAIEIKKKSLPEKIPKKRERTSFLSIEMKMVGRRIDLGIKMKVQNLFVFKNRQFDGFPSKDKNYLFNF